MKVNFIHLKFYLVFYFMLTLNGFAVIIVDGVAVNCVLFCRTAERVLSVA